MTRITKGDVNCEFTQPMTRGDSGTWMITCSICHNKIGWRHPEPVSVVRLAPFDMRLKYAQREAAAAAAIAIEELSITCPNKRPSGSELIDCGTQWSITYDPAMKGTQNEIVDIKISPTTDIDRFWTDYGKKTIGDNLDLLDKRSEYMITTIAALIATNFAVLVAFDVKFSGDFTLRIVPNIFLAFSAAFFAIAHFAIKEEIQIQSPNQVRSAHEKWVHHKHLWQKLGYGFFVVGLFFIGMTYLVSQHSGPDVQNIKGNLNLTIIP